MVIIGDELIPYEKISKINNIEDIKNTPSNSLLVFDYNEEIMKYCFENSLFYAVRVDSVLESVYSNALSARYILANSIKGTKIQKVADNYIFDSKILLLIDNKEEINIAILKEIDGVFFKKLLN